MLETIFTADRLADAYSISIYQLKISLANALFRKEAEANKALHTTGSVSPL